ncbi:MAG: glycoside hydrolase family 27 protein [Bacteroidales bacterium]|nr:glycoside hydrolase family 27 protein [Bacteroidales bacterium]
MKTLNFKTNLCYVTAIFLLISTNALFSQTGSKTPAMGWASWNQFGVNISENVIKGQADAMASSGLAAAGFQYINIDDGFFYGRNTDGTLKINPTKFPNGMKPVADYIHSKGLKAGFYSDAGANTCGYQYSGQTMGAGVGLYEHDQQDCDLIFKTWGFDYYKVDYCGGLVLKLDEKTRYTAIRQAIIKTGREVNLNVCRWQFPGTWVTEVGDSWRMSRDINFVPGSTPTWSVIMEILDLNTFLAPYCSPGHYNDMDMLEVGRGMPFEEDKKPFSMWCILSSPLLLGNDLTKMSAQTKSILTNTEVIAVNQDTTGLQAHLISDNGAGLQVWAKNLNGKQSLERAVAFQ